MNRLIMFMSIFSFLSCKTSSKVQYMPDTKYYISFEIVINPDKFQEVRNKIKNYIETSYNNDKSKPKVVSTNIYFAKNHPLNKYGPRLIIYTNFVNERSRKYEFDNLTFYNFVQTNISIPVNILIGGNKSDLDSADNILLYSDQYINYKVVSSWIIEDPNKISLYHNDYEIKEKIQISGFEKNGEPEIRVMTDGSLVLVFNLMPPSNMKETDDDLGEFKDFDKFLSEKLGVEVEWVDREIFYIKSPKKGTTQDIKNILENYWNRKN